MGPDGPGGPGGGGGNAGTQQICGHAGVQALAHDAGQGGGGGGGGGAQQLGRHLGAHDDGQPSRHPAALFDISPK